jgi:glycine cleavage system pyridoxal-binding protein P
MPFIAHTEADVESMLNVLGVDSGSALFDEIPNHLIVRDLGSTGSGMRIT